MTRLEFDLIRAIIGNEFDKYMDENQEEIGKVEMGKKDFDRLYFKIRESMERHIKIEENPNKI